MSSNSSLSSQAKFNQQLAVGWKNNKQTSHKSKMVSQSVRTNWLYPLKKCNYRIRTEYCYHRRLAL